MNEAETRAEYIDPALKSAGWGEVEGKPDHGGSTRSHLADLKVMAAGASL
jgi:type I site-specific restriction endonuclease